MDIFEKYTLPAMRHERVLEVGTDPFGVCMEELYSATEARVNGRRTILVGTNNYLGLTYDERCMDAAIGAIRKHGTGTTGSRIAKVLARSRNNCLEPREPYEVTGRTPNVVFPTGLIVDEFDKEGFAVPTSTVRLYYGAAGTSVAVATTTVRDLLAMCLD